ncbi:MAG: hypothetical protein KC445_04710 [Anaerolineales bacterium]|nr:hypothetical protein [Anaerolineales bacterium]
MKFDLRIALLLILGLAIGCQETAVPTSTAPSEISPADLSGIKSYLLEKGDELGQHTLDLQTAVNAYYELAQAANFAYAQLWAAEPEAVATSLLAAKDAWMLASPGYEQIEGIVAGVPALAEYDLILDAGGAGDGEDAAPYDLTLPDGAVLARPGNLFGVLESAQWGTNDAWFSTAVQPDLDGNGTVDFGEVLPDANLLKGAADALADYVAQLQASAQAWQPTESDAFTALVVMIPTMNEYFESWKNSRFVAGEASEQADFVVISRLADIQDILSSLQVIHAGVSPLIVTVDPAQDDQIGDGLSNLKTYVADVYAQEQAGKQFTAEEADLLGGEAQTRAENLAGQIVQLAAQLNIPIED